VASSVKAALLTAAVLCLSACAARPVSEIAISQPGDDQLSCDAIKQQMADNSAQEATYVRKDKDVENGNTAKAVASATPFVGPLIALSTDLSNAEQVKARALADRNERLAYLAKQKGCTP
jgi:hypothetical protein